MQIPHRLRRRVVAFSLTLACLAASAPVLARSQDANFIRINTVTIAERPTGVRGDLLLASDGNIYFTSSTGGLGNGFVGKLAPNGTISTLHAFADADGAPVQPFAGVIQASDGDFYGTTYLGGRDGAGTVYKVTLSGTFTLLHSFGATTTDAALPYTGLVEAPDGNLYGTTFEGGNNRKGTIYRISRSGTGFEIIHHFNGGDGHNPEGALIVGSDGELYGTTLQGGAGNRGTIYRISTSGAFTLIHSFPRLGAFNSIGIAINETGANPRAGLLLAADGNYYGTAYQGGPGGYGTVFRMTPAGAVSVFHAFTGPRLDGGFPTAAVVQDADGTFYGTSENGGYFDVGAAWRISSSGEFRLLHGFLDSGVDNANPRAGLLLAFGAAYGAAFTDASGTLFKLDLGSNGVLPVELSVSPAEATCVSNSANACGVSATVTWSSPTAATCTASGSWPNVEVASSGTHPVTVTSAGNYTYGLSCTDGAGVVRNAYAALAVAAPPRQPVDGGGGAGASSWLLLLLLAVLLSTRKLREIAQECP